MKKFPQVARARLASLRAGVHPDAGELNAFAENALVPQERETVLEHLSACADCREIVALAAAAQPSDTPITKPARAGFRWVTLQWAAVAASVAIVTTAVIVIGPHQHQTVQRATELTKQQPATAPSGVPSDSLKKEPASLAARSPSEVSGHAAKGPIGPAREANAKLDRDYRAKVATKPGYLADGVNITDGGFGGIGVYSRNYPSKGVSAPGADEKKKELATNSAGKSAPSLTYSTAAASADTDSFVDGKVAANTNQPVSAGIQAGAARPQPAPATPIDGERGRADLQKGARNEISKDKQTAAASSGEAVEIVAQTQSVESSATRATGAKTSQSGGVAGAAMTRMPLRESLLEWRALGDKIEGSADAGATWQDRSPGKNVQWTSVAALAGQVWAGGKAGTLYHSIDNGQTWKKISLTGDDIIPLGDVSAIKITNPTLVDIILNTGEDWQTRDGGKSFRLFLLKK